jgi:hypothetical protein
MSTLKTTNLQHPSAASPAIVLDADGGMSGAFPSPNRNLLYNGAMQVHQRGTSTAGITGTGYYTADRWMIIKSNFGTWTNTVENDAPSGSGFRNSYKVLCTTSSASPAADDYAVVIQQLEGQDVQRIMKGTAQAQPLTLSFWAKSNVTGTHTVTLYDADNTRGVSASYTISASATWTRHVVTFTGDTTGIFDNDNQSSLQVYFNLGGGSNRAGGSLQTSWGAWGFDNSWMGSQVNVAASTNNYWQVTGVQLEVGTAATPFEFKRYAQELQECERYYQRLSNWTGFGEGTTAISATFPLHQPLRSSPSVLAVISGSTLTWRTVAGSDGSDSSWSILAPSTDFRTAIWMLITNVSDLTDGHPYQNRYSNFDALLEVGAEL